MTYIRILRTVTYVITGIAVGGLLFLYQAKAEVPAGKLPVCSVIEEKTAQAFRDYFPQWRDAKIIVEGNFDKRKLELLTDVLPVMISKVSIPEESIPSGKHIVKIELSTQPTQSFFLQTKVMAIARRCVSIREISPQEALTPELFTLAPVNLTAYSDMLVSAPENVVGMESKTRIKKDEVIRAWMIRPRPVFRRGAEVTLVYREEQVELRFKGKAMEDGFVGKKVKCFRLNSVKSFSGIVIDEKTVLIKN